MLIIYYIFQILVAGIKDISQNSILFAHVKFYYKYINQRNIYLVFHVRRTPVYNNFIYFSFVF